MSRHKRRKFSELATFPNFISEPYIFKGKWNEIVFKNLNPLVLELGCGKGEFSITLARLFPEKNFIGIDLDGARLWRAGKDALTLNLSNVVFVQANIQSITEIFSENEASEIWIPFPDPYPKPSKWKKRLISSIFLDYYKNILQPGSMLHFKTDNTALFEFGLKSIYESGFYIIEYTYDLYNSALQNEFNTIPSYFESLFKEKGEPIKYARFSF